MKKSFLLCATAILLGACGGGGGGGATPTTAPTPTVNLDNKPAEPTPTISDNNTETTKNTQTEATETKMPEPTAAHSTPPAPIEIKPNEVKTDNTSKVEAQPSSPIETKPEIKEITKLENTGIYLDKNQFEKGELTNIGMEIGGKRIATLSGYNRSYSFNGAMKKDKELNEIVIDKVVIRLIKKGVEATGLAGMQAQALTYALKTAYNASKDPKRDIFYFGLETTTADMPKSGIATYRGNASRYDNISGNVTNIGTSTLYADFGRKKISGDLAINKGVLGAFRRDISLKETDIKGNGFSGRATAGEDNILFRTVEGRYEGKFYGPKAEEVAGKATFQGEAIVGQLESLNTSFSAERGVIH
ncbi:Slam-dependent surface lipoprotein [Neisseria sp. HMSC064E01]|jgi:transferrin binding protein|uniref:Slam-dependent surface lipoprotein n=1 Tax=Neisseria sp. HMSC064E01 TaxID=1715052 RepID=UPI000B3195D0|nr:Slam-dependent surface lipoprotein [Neisseria sp. HMSC064E01]